MNIVPVSRGAVIEIVPSIEVALKRGKEITLAQAEEDFYIFCAEHGINATVHRSAWTETTLGRQNISAYDFYNMIDEIKRGILNSKPNAVTANEYELLE